MRKRFLLLPILALVMVLGSALSATSTHASIKPHATTVNGVPFATNTNGCNGNVIPVYGSSLLKVYMLQSAIDYCAAFKAAHGGSGAGGPDVEYASGGDSCPGALWASTTATGNANGNVNAIGLSDIYYQTCTTEGIPVSASGPGGTGLNPDQQVAAFPVNMIAQCPGAAAPQGGSWNGGSSPCLGGAEQSGACTFATNTFQSPSDLSYQQAALLWLGGSTDFAAFNGCSGVSPGNQNRASGSGTRGTFCTNLYGPFTDLCSSGNVAQPDTATTGKELAAVCGIPSGVDGTIAPQDGANSAGGSFVGYVGRSAVIAPYTLSGVPVLNKPIAGCGLVSINGKNASNGLCNPNNQPTPNQTKVIGPGGVANPNGSGFEICPGDLQVALGQYTIFGYAHAYSAKGLTNPDVSAFLTFLRSNTEQKQLFNLGLLRECQLNVSRTVDGGPYSASPGSC